MQEATINLYTIEKCGYFNHNNTSNFCSISDTLNGLKQWAVDKELADTALHDPNKENDTLPAYLLDIASQNNI